MKTNKFFGIVLLSLFPLLGCNQDNKQDAVEITRGKINVRPARELPFPYSYFLFRGEEEYREKGYPDETQLNYEFVKDNHKNTNELSLIKKYQVNRMFDEYFITSTTKMITFVDNSQDNKVDYLIRYQFASTSDGDLEFYVDTLDLTKKGTTFINNREDISQRYKNLVERIK